MGIQDEDLVTKNRHGEKESGTHTDTQCKGTQPRPVREGRGGERRGEEGRGEVRRDMEGGKRLKGNRWQKGILLVGNH